MENHSPPTAEVASAPRHNRTERIHGEHQCKVDEIHDVRFVEDPIERLECVWLQLLRS